MYGRRYGGRELRFEASGGLLNAALVMRDKETGSYWPILLGEAASGPLTGTRLEERPLGVKMQWKDWVRAHPDTRVLSVGGVEHVENNPYDQYIASDSGFRRLSARDTRLPTKEPIWAFEMGGRRLAVPLREVEGGAALKMGDLWIFFHRPKGAAVYLSTRAFVSTGPVALRDGAWTHTPSGAVFDPGRGAFDRDPPGVQPLAGYDTFWYVWSLTHPGTEILDPRP